MKRITDVTVAFILLLVLAPLIGAVALSVRLALGSPVIFRHRRPGLNGKIFTLLKFRTMREAIDGDRDSDEARLTIVGRFLRSASLDELPELFNVIKGDMSLVGPRPLLPEYLALYSPEQMRRHSVRPGITGWAQVNGRNAISWKEKFAYDLWYVDHQSFALDLRILILTIWKVFARQGISADGHATTQRFDGHA